MLSIECVQIDEVLDRRGGIRSRDVWQHLDRCARCRSLYTWMAEDSLAIRISPALHRRIAGPLLLSLQPVKPLAIPGHDSAAYCAVLWSSAARSWV